MAAAAGSSAAREASKSSETSLPSPPSILRSPSGHELEAPVIGRDGVRRSEAKSKDEEAYVDRHAREFLDGHRTIEELGEDAIHLCPMREPVIASDGMTYDLSTLLTRALLGDYEAPFGHGSLKPLVYRNVAVARQLELDTTPEALDLRALVERVPEVQRAPLARQMEAQIRANDPADAMRRYREAAAPDARTPPTAPGLEARPVFAQPRLRPSSPPPGQSDQALAFALTLEPLQTEALTVVALRDALDGVRAEAVAFDQPLPPQHARERLALDAQRRAVVQELRSLRQRLVLDEHRRAVDAILQLVAGR